MSAGWVQKKTTNIHGITYTTELVVVYQDFLETTLNIKTVNYALCFFNMRQPKKY